jgi:hypothetical protein
MATLNPLEQKARISFIKGLLIAGLIGAIGIGLLVWQLTVRDKKIKDEQGKITSGVLVLAHDVSSGQLLSDEDFKTISALKSTLPTHYFGSTAELDLGKLQDKNGNEIKKVSKVTITNGQSKEEFYYPTEEIPEDKIAGNSNITVTSVETTKDDPAGKEIYAIHYKGNVIEEGKVTDSMLALFPNRRIIWEKLILGQDEYGNVIYERAIANSDGTTSKEKVELDENVLVPKIDIKANTVVSASMFTKAEEQVSNDLREQEYNMISLPVNLEDKDTIDIRLRLPNGADYIVLTKKNVSIPKTADGYMPNTVILKCSEAETMTMSAAIVDTYQMLEAGAKLYAVKYTDPGLQETATATYLPSGAVMKVISTNPNIVEDAKTKIFQYYVANQGMYRNSTETGIESGLTMVEADDRADGISDNTKVEITTTKDNREEYLETLLEQ